MQKWESQTTHRSKAVQWSHLVIFHFSWTYVMTYTIFFLFFPFLSFFLINSAVFTDKSYTFKYKAEIVDNCNCQSESWELNATLIHFI